MKKKQSNDDGLDIPDFLIAKNRKPKIEEIDLLPSVELVPIEKPLRDINAKIRNVIAPVSQVSKEIFSELEGMIDDVLHGTIEEPNFSNFYAKKDAPASCLKRIVEKYTPVLDELKNEGNDPQIKEGYSRYSKKEMSRMITLYENIINSAARDLDNRKRLTKFKSQRRMSVTKIVSKVKYLKYDSTLNLTSLAPEKLVNTSSMVTYDNKTRSMKVYKALDGVSLSFRGTTILNFDPEKSIEKKIRKPEEIVLKAATISKSEFNALFKNLSTKGKNITTGRVNENTLFLRGEK